MDQVKAVTIISKDTVVEGVVQAEGGTIEVYGQVDGQLSTATLHVHEGGRVKGELEAENLMTQGAVAGTLRVSSLLDIGETGAVNGDIRYGRLAMREGGELSAELKNIPPVLEGDLKLEVSKGKAVRLTTKDLTAVDPDDNASALTFSVLDTRNGYVVNLDAPKVAARSFTQEELEAGKVVFAHDGKESTSASFSIKVTDAEGATSGPAKTVAVKVRG